MKKKRLLSKAVLGLIILIFLAGFYFNYTIFSPADSNNTENISIIIKKGSSIGDIAETLAKNGLIKSNLTFNIYTRFTGGDKKIIAGRFILNKSMNVPEILDTITTKTESEFVLTVQEGLTVNDIDVKLAEMELINPGEFIKTVKEFNDYESYWFLNREKMSGLEAPLEGYLYPDTYFIDPVDFNSGDLIAKMLNNFEKKYKTLDQILIQQNIDPHKTIIMASILQREVRTAKDYNLVSGILWKRYESNWHIGADATILYATKKKKIDSEDLAIDSPYNTRLYVGMPPGPICNPDIEHIKAAFEPQTSDYWYYLTTADTGEVIYAKTNEEHNINKARYL
ncbi:endolytic transglycosylase MltG [Candidatus Peregrinibacteria bacterium]|nr:endolytic transglycosylase MltG [Candidatus Peregrinibacteria bacterium]